MAKRFVLRIIERLKKLNNFFNLSSLFVYSFRLSVLILSDDHCHASCSLRSHYQRLLDVGCL